MSNPAEARQLTDDEIREAELQELAEAWIEAEEHPERLITLTPDELQAMAETGEWPASFG